MDGEIMKAFAVVLLAVVCLVAGYLCCYYDVITIQKPAEEIAKVPEINRVNTILYPESRFKWRSKTCISLINDRYYHGTISCSFFPALPTDYLVVSEYEAVERGYKACPNCVKVKAKIE